MVFVGDKKYACETCIKGHRSSSCRHTDRPLFEIKKKGRPVTQCEHCRELRKTRQIHVKCVCESKDPVDVPASAPSKAGTKDSARAAFPGGLPQELLLEASVASQPFSESDSDHSTPACTCRDSAACTCWTPRVRGKRPSKTASRRGSSAAANIAPAPGEVYSQPAALVANAHSGNKRPVLPKPPSERPGSPSRSPHDPSVIQSSRHPGHGQAFYSPYGRAYEQTRPSSHSPVSSAPPPHLPNFLDGAADPDTRFGDWPLGQDNSSFSPSPVSPPVCGCGPSCQCAGCLEHRGPDVDPSTACVNPTTCVACLECNINSLTALATDTTRSVYDPSTIQNIDDWLRQVSSMPDLPSSAMQLPPMFPSSSSLSQPDLRFDSAMIDNFNMWGDLLGPQAQAQSQSSPMITDDHCGGQCSCQSGFCACASNCNGFLPHGGSGRTLTFATSGERGQCCGGRHAGNVQQPGGPSVLAPSNDPDDSMTGYTDGSWLAPPDIPRTSLSRASSSSSRSSHFSVSSPSPDPLGDLDIPPAVEATGVRSCCTGMGSLNTRASSSASPVSPSPHPYSADHNQYRTSSSSGGHAPPFSGFSNSCFARPF